MIEGVPVEDDKSKLLPKFARSKIKLLGIAMSMVIIMLLVSFRVGLLMMLSMKLRKIWGFTTEFQYGKGQSGHTLLIRRMDLLWNMVNMNC